MDRPVIALAAGGTGGHVFPAQAVAQALMDHGYTPILLTDERGAVFADPASGLPTYVLPARSLAGGLFSKIETIAAISSSMVRAALLLRRRRARLVIGFGGYPSFAPCIAAKVIGLPIMLHEQATRFSLANRRLLSVAHRVALSFPIADPVTQKASMRIVGPAVRPAIAAVAGSPYPSLGGPIELLVVGGSQGGRIFAETVPQALERLPEVLRRRLCLTLQYRGEDAGSLLARLQEAGIRAETAPFLHDMAERLVRAHLVICRAGASTAADVTTVGRPAIFVPIPTGGSADEQRDNAMSFERAGAGWYLPQTELEGGGLTATLLQLLERNSLTRAAFASAALGKADGARAMAEYVADIVPLD